MLSLGYYASKLLSAGYSSVGADFDGTNDYMSRGADLTGNSNGKSGIISFWIKPEVDATTLNIYNADNGGGAFGLQLQLSSSGFITIQAHDISDGEILNIRTTLADFTVANGWRHVLASWDLATASSWIYVDDASSQTVTTRADFTIDYTTTNHYIGHFAFGGSKMNGCLAELYFTKETSLDLSVESNRRKFISATGYPVSLGADGSLPTGAIPILYIKDWTGTNSGTGGNFTITGALTDCVSDPSD